MPTFTLRNSVKIGTEHKPYVIAEVNSSHYGNMETAKQMIDAAADCGCNCVKFQSWSDESLYSRTYSRANPIAARFIKRWSLSSEQLLELAEYCKNAGVDFSSTPYSREEVDFLADKADAPFIKISSMELNNYPFLDYIARKGAPVILSTGMGTMEEVCRAVDTIEKAGNHDICLLHCISVYPPEISEINLLNIVGLQEKFPNYPVGFSDHSAGTEMAAAAIALGACLIEKHLTLDKSKIGLDNQMATEPDEMKLMVRQCHNVWTARGSKERVVLESELEQRKSMRRSLIYTRDMEAGEVIAEGDIDAKRPGTGFPPEDMPKFIGRTVTHKVEKDTLIVQEDFE